MTYEERMELAGRLRDLILQRHGDNVLTVFITSSTARGLDLEFSDLELAAGHRDGSAPENRSYYHCGILIEVEHVEETRILDQRMRRQWPASAGEYRGRIVLYERDRWIARLDAILDARDAADPVPAQRNALYFHQAFECPLLPPAFQDQMEILLSVRHSDPKTHAEAAETLTKGLVQLAAARGIETESGELLV